MWIDRNDLDFPMRDFRRELDRVFQSFWGNEGVAALPAAEEPSPSGPAFNLWEDDRSLFVESELPGLVKEDLVISVEHGRLLVSGERYHGPSPEAACHRRERPAGRFSRALSLPCDVDAEKAVSRYEDGVLTITLPKAPSALPRKIEVKCVP